MTQEITMVFQLTNLKGIHARVAAKIVKTAELFEADAIISYNNMTVPLLSIMGLMLLSARKGAKLTIQASGAQNQELIKALHDLFNRNFDED